MRILAAIFLCLLIPVVAFAQNEQAVPTTGEIDFTKEDHPSWAMTLDPFSTRLSTGPYVWSAFHKGWEFGDSKVDLFGGLSTSPESMAVGDDLSVGHFSTTAQYRYDGILGGAIRPVGRFTIGAGQVWAPLSGPGFSGYGGGMMGYVMPEAGVEFTVKIKGRRVGVGVTEAYLHTVDSFGSNTDDITGPGYLGPQTSPSDFADWFTKVYPIFE
jgi:hypothetical protein